MRTSLLFLVIVVLGLSLAVIGAESWKPGAPHSYASRLSQAARIVDGSERDIAVVFVDRVVNHGDKPITNVRIRMHAPLRIPEQTIAKLKVEGEHAEVFDRWGAPVLVYEAAQIGPGQMLTGRWTAWATIRQVEWNLQKPPASGGPALSPEEKSLYLRDAEGFCLTDPRVTAAAKEAAAGKTDAIGTLQGIFDLVMGRLKYVMDSSWKPAPKVLESGEGSCSEYSYCFVALCRVNGIPSRYVGGFTGKLDVPFHIDWAHHRYPQAFVPHEGWVDFDPTRTDGRKDRRLFFGRTSQPMLLTCVGDGGEGSLTGWSYLSTQQWTGDKGKASAVCTGWWFPPPPQAIKDKVARLAERMAKRSSNRSSLIAEALDLAHPFILPWLDDLLYDPSVRPKTAEAFLKIGGERAIRPVVASLGRVNDSKGDDEIAEILRRFSGQTWGKDRAKWNDWLKSKKL